MSCQETYPRVSYLPLTKDISGLGSVCIEHFRDEEIQEIYDLACGAAARGEDIGVDEFPTLDSWMDKILTEAESSGIFTIRDAANRTLKAAIHFNTSRFGRSLTPCLAETILVMAEGVRKNPDTFQELVQLAEELVRDCGNLYTGTTIETFIHSHDSIKALRAARFNMTLVLPVVVRAPKIGITESVVFFKDFGTPFPQVTERTEDEGDKESAESLIAKLEIPQIPFLPVERPLMVSGIPAVIRNATKDDIAVMYKIFKVAADSGVGYSVDEFPDVNTFVKLVMGHYYSAIIENKQTGEIIGFVQFAVTVFRRTEDSPMADCHVAVNPSISGRGLGIDIGDVLMRCAAQLGFKYMISDTLITHTPVINITRKLNYKIIGNVPNVAYIKGQGWVDCIYLLHDVADYPKMTATESKAPSTNGVVTAQPANSKL